MPDMANFVQQRPSNRYSRELASRATLGFRAGIRVAARLGNARRQGLQFRLIARNGFLKGCDQAGKAICWSVSSGVLSAIRR